MMNEATEGVEEHWVIERSRFVPLCDDGKCEFNQRKAIFQCQSLDEAAALAHSHSTEVDHRVVVAETRYWREAEVEA